MSFDLLPSTNPFKPLDFKTLEDFRRSSLTDITKAEVVTVGGVVVKDRKNAASNLDSYTPPYVKIMNSSPYGRFGKG